MIKQISAQIHLLSNSRLHNLIPDGSFVAKWIRNVTVVPTCRHCELMGFFVRKVSPNQQDSNGLFISFV